LLVANTLRGSSFSAGLFMLDNSNACVS